MLIMNLLDLIIILLIFLSGLIGFFRGFIREALSIIVWLIAIWLAWTFSESTAIAFFTWIDPPEIRIWAARLSIILVSIIVGTLAAWVIGRFIKKIGLGYSNNSLGILFGFARGFLIFGLIVILVEYIDIDQSAWWIESRLIPFGEYSASCIRYYLDLFGYVL